MSRARLCRGSESMKPSCRRSSLVPVPSGCRVHVTVVSRRAASLLQLIVRVRSNSTTRRGNFTGNYGPSRTKIMGPGWGRTVRHRSAQPGTARHASCPLTCTNGLGEHQSSPSGTPSFGLLIRRLWVRVSGRQPRRRWQSATGWFTNSTRTRSTRAGRDSDGENGLLLCSQDRPEEALAAYDQVVDRYGEDPGLSQQVAPALVNKGIALDRLRLATWHGTHRRLDKRREAHQRRRRPEVGIGERSRLGWRGTRGQRQQRTRAAVLAPPSSSVVERGRSLSGRAIAIVRGRCCFVIVG